MRVQAFANGRPLSGVVLTFGGQVVDESHESHRSHASNRSHESHRSHASHSSHEVVPPEISAERLSVCESCDRMRERDGLRECSICGCGTDRRVKRLVTREEYGALRWCRHPARGSGAGWRR